MEGRGFEDKKTVLNMEGWEGCDVILGSRVSDADCCVNDAGNLSGLPLCLMIAFDALA